MIVRNTTIVILMIGLVLFSVKVNAQKISYTTYVNLGVLLTPPSSYKFKLQIL